MEKITAYKLIDGSIVENLDTAIEKELIINQKEFFQDFYGEVEYVSNSSEFSDLILENKNIILNILTKETTE